MDQKIEDWGREFCRRHGITWELVTPEVIEKMYREFEAAGMLDRREE